MDLSSITFYIRVVTSLRVISLFTLMALLYGFGKVEHIGRGDIGNETTKYNSPYFLLLA